MAFIPDREVIAKILRYLREETEPPTVWLARGPPQGALEFDQTASWDARPEVDHTAGLVDEV